MKHILFFLLTGMLCIKPAFAQEHTKLTASDGESGDFLFTVGFDGASILLGANSHGAGQGAVYVFEQDGATWTETTKLTADDDVAIEGFGQAMDVSGDYAIIGAPRTRTNGFRSGAAYVFKREGGMWVQQERLIGSDTDEMDNFGSSVALQGKRALIAAPSRNAVYVFEQEEDVWLEKAILTPPDDARNFFGNDIALSGDYVLIGSNANSDVAQNAGAAFILKREADGNWTHQAKLTAGDAQIESRFGSAVALGGGVALIGAVFHDGIGENSGAVYVFEQEGDTWTEQVRLEPSDAVEDHRFGNAVALRGGLAVIGARGDATKGEAAGAAYLFRQTLDGAWEEATKLIPNEIDPDDRFGSQVGLGDGIVVISAAGDDEQALDAGAAYVFTLPNMPPSPAVLTSPADETAFELAGDPAQPLSVAWSPGVDPDGDVLTYTWQLSLTEDFLTPLLHINAGTETQITTNFGAVATALTAAGVGLGQEVTAFHRVFVTDGLTEVPGTTFRLRLGRGMLTSAEEESSLPTHYRLDGNYPNPFNPSTTIRYALPEAVPVRLAVYDMLGREVALLADSMQGAGTHTVRFEAGSLPGGVYLYRLEAGRERATGRMVLVK